MKVIKNMFLAMVLVAMAATATYAQCGNELPSFQFQTRIRVLDMYLHRTCGTNGTAILLPQVRNVVAEIVNIVTPSEPENGTPKCPPPPEMMEALKYLQMNNKQIDLFVELNPKQNEDLYNLSRIPGYQGNLVLNAMIKVEKRVNPTLLPTDKPTYHYLAFITDFAPLDK